MIANRFRARLGEERAAGTKAAAQGQRGRLPNPVATFLDLGESSRQTLVDRRIPPIHMPVLPPEGPMPGGLGPSNSDFGSWRMEMHVVRREDLAWPDGYRLGENSTSARTGDDTRLTHGGGQARVMPSAGGVGSGGKVRPVPAQTVPRVRTGRTPEAGT